MNFVEKELTKAEFEQQTKGQIELFYSGYGNYMDIALYLNRENNHYYFTGPFGRWEGTAYWDLGHKDDETIKNLIKGYLKDRPAVPNRINFKLN